MTTLSKLNMTGHGKAKLLIVMVLLFGSSICAADIFLTSENLNASLKDMQRLQRQFLNVVGEERNNILYQLGIEADTLAKLLTDEVAAHGPQNEGLISLALERTEKIAIDISWYGQHQSFYYDGSAFEQYLRASPEGQHAPDSLYRQIKRNFYLIADGSTQDLISSSNAKKQFIGRYPDFAEIHELELFLAIDLRDLWRHYRASSDNAAARDMEYQVREQYERIIDRYQDREAADIARRLLARFEEELRQRGQDSP